MRGFADALPSRDDMAAINGPGLARVIVQLCEGVGKAPSRFGREAMNDPALVSNLRAGRRLGRRCHARVLCHFDALRVGKAVRHG